MKIHFAFRPDAKLPQDLSIFPRGKIPFILGGSGVGGRREGGKEGGGGGGAGGGEEEEEVEERNGEKGGAAGGEPLLISVNIS